MKNPSQVEELDKRGIGKLLLRFYFPAFAGVMANSLYSIVDRIYIGQGVGALALSGLSVVFPIMILFMAFGMLVSTGASVRISLNLGRRDNDRAEKVLGNGVTLVVFLGGVLTLLGFLFKEPVLNIFGAGEETFGYANDYLSIIIAGSTFGMLGFSLNNMIRSEGSVKIAMYSMFITAGLNIVLDPVFIFLLDMGVQGAAIATVISQMVLCVWVILHFRSSRSVIKLKIKNLKPVREILVYIITIGLAPFSMHIAGSIVHGLFNVQLIEFGGDIAVGAMGVINSVTIMLIMTIVSLNMASQPIIGFNYGARKYDRVMETVRTAIVAATVIATAGWLLFISFPDAIISAFNSDSDELRGVGVEGLIIYNAMLPIVGFQIIASNFFQSIGKARLAIFLTLLRQGIFIIPLLFILPQFFGLMGIWLAMPVSDVASGSLSFVFLRREILLLKRQKERYLHE